MHPALMIAVMEERDREIARLTRNAWKRPTPKPRRSRHRVVLRSVDGAPRRLVGAFSRRLASSS
jgi:hypothetical protein